MSSPWIKIRTNLAQDPDLMKLSDALGTEDAHTVGLLVIFWSWVDGQTMDGAGMAVTRARLDKLIGREGFTAALLGIGWLAGEDGDYRIPNYERHSSTTSKARMLEAEAKRLRRALAGEMSDNCPTPPAKNVRPDKIREEEKIKEGASVPQHAHAAAAPPVSPCPAPAPEVVVRPSAPEPSHVPRPPQATATSGTEPLIRRINALSPAWGRIPGFTAAERHLLEGNRAALSSICHEDWVIMRDYMAARLPEGSAAWQPRSRAKFLEHPTDVLSHATAWHRKRPAPRAAPPPSAPPRPQQPAAPAYTRQELAAMLSLNGRPAS